MNMKGNCTGRYKRDYQRRRKETIYPCGELVLEMKKVFLRLAVGLIYLVYHLIFYQDKTIIMIASGM